MRIARETQGMDDESSRPFRALRTCGGTCTFGKGRNETFGRLWHLKQHADNRRTTTHGQARQQVEIARRWPAMELIGQDQDRPQRERHDPHAPWRSTGKPRSAIAEP